MIIGNEPCPECQKNGHDKTGNHLMVFEDGGKYCSRSEWHDSGEPLYIAPDGNYTIIDTEITGTIKYTIKQFRELMEADKLNTPQLRNIALSGMRFDDQYAVGTEPERVQLLKKIERDKKYFDQLKFKNLVSRHIPGNIAKFYNVRVGLGIDGRVTRHYYPVYDREMKWKGAKCRTLPKDFRYNSLGNISGDNILFGQFQNPDVMASGGRYDTLLLVGGECDAMAAQTMLKQATKGTKWEKQYKSVWSPMQGESIKEILLNKEEIDRFKKIIVCFDNDTVGNKLNHDVGKLFLGKVHKLKLPSGCKDPNDCLKQGRGQEFVNAYWEPVDVFDGASLNSLDKYREEAKRTPEMGISWPWKSLNSVTFGIRTNCLSVWGGGTGCGKTKVTKEIVFNLAYKQKKPVVVIYLEEQAVKTVRSFAGELINKDLTAPPCTDQDDPDYSKYRDYTKEQADAAIDELCDDGLIMIADLQGRKDIESVMQVLEEALAVGYQYFIIDNLTAFEHKGKGTGASAVEAIDETMKRLGTFKDEHEVFIMLLSHLKKPTKDKVPHEEGGRVSIQDFRGSGSICFWANSVFGITRNTVAENMQDKCLAIYENLKNRDIGYKTGSKVYVTMDLNTGKLVETNYRPAVSPRADFDDGTKKRIKTKEKEF